MPNSGLPDVLCFSWLFGVLGDELLRVNGTLLFSCVPCHSLAPGPAVFSEHSALPGTLIPGLLVQYVLIISTRALVYLAQFCTPVFRRGLVY